MNLTACAVRRRVSTWAIVFALVVLGFYGLRHLPVDFLPDLAYPLIKVNIHWPGASPEEVDRNIAEPVERLMATVDRLDFLESSCREGFYSLDLNFEYGADVDVAFQDVLAAMSRVQRRLPADSEAPFIFKADPAQLPVLNLVVSGEHWGPVALRAWAEDHLQRHLLALPGVAGVDISGGLEREIRILLDPLALEKHRLPLAEVLATLRAENIERVGGRLHFGRREIILRTGAEFTTLDEIGALVIARGAGGYLRLRDIATVVDGHEEARLLVRLDGRPGVRLSVVKEAGANTVAVARLVREALDGLAPALPEGIRFEIIDDQAVYVSGALAGVRDAAAQAVLLLLAVVYLFLGSFRRVLVMLVALPLAVIINFGLMRLAGFTLNVFSLGGLVVAIGLVIDTSIIVLENISRHQAAQPGAAGDRLAVTATGEVGAAIVAATLSFLALFLPFLLVPGLVTLLFREQVLVIAGIVVVSLLVALTVTPMLATGFLPGGGESGRAAAAFARFFTRLTRGYGRLLQAVVRRRAATIPVFCLLLGGAILLAGRLGGEFIPPVDDGRLVVRVNLPTGTALGETDRLLRRVEAMLAEDPLVVSAFSVAGGRVRGYDILEVAHEGQVYVQLAARNRRDISTGDYARRLSRALEAVSAPGGRVVARPMHTRGIRGLRDADVVVEVRGPEMDELARLAGRTAALMREAGFFESVSVGLDLSRPEYRVRLDRTRAAALGLSALDVADSLRAFVAGASVGYFREGDQYSEILVLVPPEKLPSPREVENLVLTARGGRAVRLGDVASLRETVGPIEISRKNQRRQVNVDAAIAVPDAAGALRALRGALEDLERPAGYTFHFGGAAGLLAEMNRSIVTIIVFALFFSFIVLAVQFNSLKIPALVLGSVPFSLAGLVGGLYLSGTAFGATVLVGILVVVAMTVNDGVLIMSFAEELRRERDLSAAAAAVAAARIRFRPRLMTTITTMAGFTPLALNYGGGGEMLVPMAVGAIAGLAAEALVSLFFMPCLYAACGRSAPRRR